MATRYGMPFTPCIFVFLSPLCAVIHKEDMTNTIWYCDNYGHSGNIQDLLWLVGQDV